MTFVAVWSRNYVYYLLNLWCRLTSQKIGSKDRDSSWYERNILISSKITPALEASGVFAYSSDVSTVGVELRCVHKTKLGYTVKLRFCENKYCFNKYYEHTSNVDIGASCFHSIARRKKTHFLSLGSRFKVYTLTDLYKNVMQYSHTLALKSIQTFSCRGQASNSGSPALKAHT